MTSWFGSPTLPGLEVARGDFLSPGRSLMTTDYALLSVASDRCTVRVGSDERRVAPGEPLLVAPLQPIVTRAPAVAGGVTVLFMDPHLLDRGFSEHRSLPASALRFPATGRPALEAAMCQVVAAIEERRPPGLAWNVLLATLSLAGGTSIALRCSERRTVRAMRDLLDRRMERVSLAEVAADLGLTMGYLSRAFAQQIGVPPHQYHLRARLARARDLLRHGCTPAATAATTGFTRTAHLCLHFRRIFGVTAGVYASAVGAPHRAPRRAHVIGASAPFVDP